MHVLHVVISNPGLGALCRRPRAVNLLPCRPSALRLFRRVCSHHSPPNWRSRAVDAGSRRCRLAIERHQVAQMQYSNGQGHSRGADEVQHVRPLVRELLGRVPSLIKWWPVSQFTGRFCVTLQHVGRPSRNAVHSHARIEYILSNLPRKWLRHPTHCWGALVSARCAHGKLTI